MTIKQLREHFEALKAKYDACATLLKDASEDFDLMTLPIDGETAGEKSAAVLVLKGEVAQAEAAWQNAMELQKAAQAHQVSQPEVERPQAPNLNFNRTGKRYGTFGEAGMALAKGEAVRQEDGALGVKVDTMNAMQKILTVTGGQNTTVIQQDATITNDPAAQSLRVINRFARTRVTSGVYVIHDLTAGSIGDSNLANRTTNSPTLASGITDAGRTYSVQAIMSWLNVPNLMLSDHDQLAARLDTQLDITVAQQLATFMLGANSTAATQFVGATAQITNTAEVAASSTADAPTKITDRLELELGNLDDGGASVDTIFLNWREYRKWRSLMRADNFAWPGVPGEGLAFGEVMGAAVIPTNLLPETSGANVATTGTLLMGPFRTNAILGVRDEMTLTRETGARITYDQTVFVARMEAALGIEQPGQIFRKLTRTDRLGTT